MDIAAGSTNLYDPLRPTTPHPSPSFSAVTSAPTTITTKPPQFFTPNEKTFTFPSYLQIPNLPPNIKLLCEIIATTPSPYIETVFNSRDVPVTNSVVEDVLRLSYSYPAAAVRFFRWSALQLPGGGNHSHYAWNLVVDLLGKNSLFDPMWLAVKSMGRVGLLSITTFASVFSSYVLADRVKEAIMSFEVMNQYGFAHDVVALNTLLSAICRDGRTGDAVEFLRIAKNVIEPDADTYAILLEGWEKGMDVISAKQTFEEMVHEIGWDVNNVPAYDAFLSTLVLGPDGLIEAMKFFERMTSERCYPGVKFFELALEECLKSNDVKSAELIWEEMVEKIGIRPNTKLYNVMIALHCYGNSVDQAKRLFDKMVCSKVFPDEKTYNMLFRSLVKGKQIKEASILYDEMLKNEIVPTSANCSLAVRAHMDSKDPYKAIEVWKCMIENHKSDLEETGNFLVAGLCYLRMALEAVVYAEGMIEKGIKLSSFTLSKLKQSLTLERKELMYEAILKRLIAQ